MTTKIKSGVISDNAITSAHISSGAISSSHLTGIDTDAVSEGSSNLYFTTTRARTSLSVTDSGGDGSLTYDNSTGVITYTGPSAAEVRAHISVTDSGGDGSLAYSNGVITYVGPSASEVRAHLSAGTGVTYSSGEFSIGQSVATTASPTFADINITGDLNLTGDINSYNITDLDIVDQTITLGVGQSESASDGSGIVIAGSNASILWDEPNDKFDINKGLNVTGKIIAGNWYQGASNTNTLYSSTSQGTIIQTPSNTNNAAGTFYIRDSLGNVHFELNTNTNVVDIAGTLDITTSGAHLKFTRSSFDTLQFGTGTGNSISGLHLTNTTDSTVPFSIHENAPDASLTLSDGGGLSVGGENAAQALSLYGSDHVYMGWYPTSGAGRKAYAGFNSAGTTTFTLYNEQSGGSMNLITQGSTTIDAGGEIILSADDNGEIVLKDGSLHYGTLLEDNSNFILRSAVNDEDIIFQGYDNGGLFTALTLDMSEAGDAYFNRRISVGGAITNTSANADDIVLGSYNDSTERGITIASTTGGGIRWNDAADAAAIQYAHSSNEMYYGSTSHHRFVSTGSPDSAGLVRINTSNSQAGVVVIKAADVTEDGIGALDLRSPNSAMRIGGTDGRSWIQSHDSQPLYLNRLGNNVIFHADGAGRVGIHHDNPLYPLHVLGTNSGAILATSTQSESTYGLIVETTVNGNPSRANIGLGSGIGLLAKIEAEQRAGGSTAYGHLAFWAADNGSLQQRMTLNYNGRLGIGLNHLDPACLVHIYETNAQNDALGLLQVQQANTTSGGSQTNASITVKNYHGTSQFMQWEENGMRIGSRITTNSGVGALYFTTGNDNVKLTIPDSGTVIFNSNQININNSGVYPIRAATSGTVLRGAAVHHLITHDHRTPLYNSMTHGHMGFGFTSYSLNNTSPWADIIYLNSYTDASGGSNNAFVVSRSASSCKVVRYDWSSTSSTAISNGTQYALAGSTSSDQRLKENVVNITNGLDTIKALRPVTFNWTDEFLQAGLSKNESEIEADENGTLIAPETKVENVGLIAQEVEEILPTIIHENEISFGGTDYKTIHYDKLVPHLIAAIKELEARVTELEG